MSNLWMRLRQWWQAFNSCYDQLFLARYSRLAARQRRDEEDLFILLCFSDILGVPNPMNYYTLEILPSMLERFHEWHLRQGLERSPIEGFR